MNAQRSASWVRRWVALYTRGLPADARRDRTDEVASDLWCQLADAEVSGEGAATGADILARLVLGIPADLRWRLDQPGAPAPVPTTSPATGSPSMNARNIARLAVVGGLISLLWIGPGVLL